MTSVLFGYKISVTAGFVRLCDLNDGKFVPLRDFNDNRFSVTVGFVPFFFFTRFQRQSVLFRYKISMMIGFIPVRDFNDGHVCSFTRFQRQSDLFHYEISMMVDFVQLRDLNDNRFSALVGFVLLRDFKDNRFCFVSLRDFNGGQVYSVTRF